jgi:methylthioribose-1-phosphate isomerase
MTEEIILAVENETQTIQTQKKSKRDIFRFNGERPTAINLEHVTNMCLEGKKITFSFYQTAIFVELADETAALSVFEVLLSTWAGDVVA